MVIRNTQSFKGKASGIVSGNSVHFYLITNIISWLVKYISDPALHYITLQYYMYIKLMETATFGDGSILILILLHKLFSTFSALASSRFIRYSPKFTKAKATLAAFLISIC